MSDTIIVCSICGTRTIIAADIGQGISLRRCPRCNTLTTHDFAPRAEAEAEAEREALEHQAWDADRRERRADD